jgi:calcium-dependent protein kinase
MPERTGVYDAIAQRLESRSGEVHFSGRYHRGQHKLEDDYVMSEIVLGAGTGGDVRLGTSIAQPGQKVAVKSFRLDRVDMDHQNYKESCQLVWEVENYMCMDHQHIAKLLDVYETEQDLHLVMECLQGGELFHRLRDNFRFSESEARVALRQMLLSLRYLHSQGIIHRDVKLDNFVYESKGSDHLKLIDFGLSRACCDGEEIRGLAGSAEYMAPEVLTGSAYSSKCDLWSLGVSGFALFQGHLPFTTLPGEGCSEVLAQIHKGQYALRPGECRYLSAEAKDFIRSLLEINPEKRLSAQQALAHPWMLRGKLSTMCDGTKNEASPQTPTSFAELPKPIRELRSISSPRCKRKAMSCREERNAKQNRVAYCSPQNEAVLAQ